MSECVVIAKGIIDETLLQVKSPGKRLLEPLKTLAVLNGFSLNILEDCEVTENDAEVHEHEGDLWLCLEGEVHFLVDGKLVDPKLRTRADGSPIIGELYAKNIHGGTRVVLTPGDWLWVPAGQPHQHICEKVARLYIIKIPVRVQ